MEEFDITLLSFKGMPMMNVRKNQVVFNAQAAKLINADFIRVFYDDNKLVIKPTDKGIPFKSNNKGEVPILAQPFLNWLQEKGFTKGKYMLTKTEEGFTASL